MMEHLALRAVLVSIISVLCGALNDSRSQVVSAYLAPPMHYLLILLFCFIMCNGMWLAKQKNQLYQPTLNICVDKFTLKNETLTAILLSLHHKLHVQMKCEM